MILVVVLVLWGIFLALAVRLRNGKGDILQRISLYLYKKIHIWGMAEKRMNQRNTRMVQTLISLHPGESPEILLQEYHVAKIRIVLLILLVVLLVHGIARVIRRRNKNKKRR